MGNSSYGLRSKCADRKKTWWQKAAEETDLIEVKNLTKYYGDKLAVDNLSFSVKEGEILGFLGPNGAGKSTTMNMLTGYLSASSGEIRINNTDMSENPSEAKKCIGYLPEIPPLYMDMTVDEYLRFMYRLKKVSGSETREEHIAGICQQVRITEVRKRLIRNLSKGYKQRVGIAQAMIGDPKILILDEPTVGLDPNQMIEIRSLIRKLGKKHTVILSSHILPEIQAVCGRIIIINEGRLAADDTEENLSRRLGASDGGKGGSCAQNCFRVLVEGPRREIMESLRAVNGVCEVDFERSVEENVFSFLLDTDGKTPVRRAVYDCVAGHGWRLLGLESREMKLEDIFIKLTAGNYGTEQLGKEKGEKK